MGATTYYYQSLCDSITTTTYKGETFATSECLSDIYHLMNSEPTHNHETWTDYSFIGDTDLPF
jgi:hypothetical protein